MTDWLSQGNALAEASIDRKAAERIATEILEPIHENVATRADVQAIKADGQGLETKLLLRLSEPKHRMTMRFGSVIVVLIGVVLAAIR